MSAEGSAREAAGGAGRLLPALGALAIAFYLVHAGRHVANGNMADAFWACHLASVLVGVGLLTGRPHPAAMGFLWLVVGDVLWGLDLATGGELIPTSLLTHVGGLVLGGFAVVRMGMPRRAALSAIGAFLVLQLLSRWLSAPATNLNLAHAVWPGWEDAFPSYVGYQAMLLTIGFMSFFVVEWGCRRALALRPKRLLPAVRG